MKHQHPSFARNSATVPRRRLDRYELIAEIASGGMGTVMLARLAGAGGFSRLFAIKLLHPHLAADQQFVHMLLDEARLASRIHHSNAVPIVDVCQSALGPYVVMDYIEGFPYSKLLVTSLLKHEERVRIGVQILLGVLGGLDAAHNLTDDDGEPLGLVHRDVSPQNVLVGLDGVGRIADFGVAHAGARITHTEPGTVKGKLAYMAPEQARGERVDRRADVFAVGVMLWECLAGRRLFKADTDAATVLRLIQEPIPPASSVHPHSPAELDAICKKALERDVAMRYASAHDMATELSRAAERAGCLATSIETADLLGERFAAEIAERKSAVRAYCAELTTGSGPVIVGEPPVLPKFAQRLHALAHTPSRRSTSFAGEVSMSIAASSPGQRKDTRAIGPQLPREPSDLPRKILLAIAALLALAAVAVLLLRHHAAEPPAQPPAPRPATPATSAPLPPPVAPSATPAPAAAAPAAIPADPSAPEPAAEKPKDVRKHRSHPREEPAIEMNPYLHR
jgi:serine/threonine protein kinase